MSLNYIDRYAHENGCGWDPRTCEYAAKRGHLECLKYVYPPFLLFHSISFLSSPHPLTCYVTHSSKDMHMRMDVSGRIRHASLQQHMDTYTA